MSKKIQFWFLGLCLGLYACASKQPQEDNNLTLDQMEEQFLQEAEQDSAGLLGKQKKLTLAKPQASSERPSAQELESFEENLLEAELAENVEEENLGLMSDLLSDEDQNSKMLASNKESLKKSDVELIESDLVVLENEQSDPPLKAQPGVTNKIKSSFSQKRPQQEEWLERQKRLEQKRKQHPKNSFSISPWAIIRAAKLATVETLDRLLTLGNSINIQNRHGQTALMSAIENNRFENAKFLLEKQANVNLRNKRGETALDIARRLGREKIIELLKKYDGSLKRDEEEL